jgi:hypothetical protein
LDALFRRNTLKNRLNLRQNSIAEQLANIKLIQWLSLSTAVSRFIYLDELEPWEAANPDFYPVKEEIDD